ncbi:murein hydrolase activator EnvC family protein [uncultured Sphingomonas sp.]|uniref:murein hydrolase activator EnvC family protein n=1 Tax=uncultured Sphingomonas sp. TaxID=158754 RepID=UPI0035C9CEF2
MAPIVVGAGALAAVAALAVPSAAPPGPTVAEQRQRLVAARAAAAAAAVRVEETRRAASVEAGAAAHARAQKLAVAAEVEAAQADLATAQVRVALVGRLLGEQRERLAAGQAPVARLLGALLSLARRPALAGIAQPGSVDDLVHLRAVLGSAVPVIRARTQGVRAEIDRTRRLEGDATLAATALADTRVTLDRRRTTLAALETQHGARADALGRTALTQSDRAIALGEQARDIVDAIADAGGQQATLAELETLPGPPTPSVEGGEPSIPLAYRLPVTGRLATGFGELSAAGVRARGLTLAVAPGAPVVAPAGGRIAYAGRFRGFGAIVIVDHGAGWTSLVTGLGAVGVTRGATVAAGARLGTAPAGDTPLVTVELRRRGRPVDPVGLL